MKIIKNIIRFIIAFFRAGYKLIDKFIVIPITKVIVLILDKFGGRTDRFEKIITKRDSLVFISLVLALLLFFYVLWLYIINNSPIKIACLSNTNLL